MNEKTIGPDWSGIVTRDMIEPLSQAIERQFGNNKRFSVMCYKNCCAPPLLGAIMERHRQLDEIGPILFDEDEPFIWILAPHQWNIHIGTFVCLTQGSMLVERAYANGRYEVWCWMLEE